MGLKENLLKGGKIVAGKMAVEALDIGIKIGADILEQQKTQIKIPDLKDVHIDEALRVLKELNMVPTVAVAKPNIGYADESENKVMNSEPKFGTRVNPGTAVKVTYVTQEVIDKSKILLENAVSEFKTPKVIGLNIYEAREDLEGLGLRVTDKLDKPSLKFANKEDGQVTRITYPNDRKIGSKLKTSERIWLYYVNDEVIMECKLLQSERVKGRQERKAKVEKFVMDFSTGTVNATKNLGQNIKKKFGKINIKSPKKKQ